MQTDFASSPFNINLVFFQMHEMLQLMPQDRDSETGSYTDSGRGPSEEGENSHQPHLETQLVDNNKSKLFYSRKKCFISGVSITGFDKE